MLTWGDHPVHGYGWTLSYLDYPDSPTAGVEDSFIPGDLEHVDEVVESAQRWLAVVRASDCAD